jgi:transcriptional regulator with XRE-family HTH domain
MQRPDSQRSATDLDRLVGIRIRQRREDLRMSQDKLATGLGISCQQLQKYERGINRVSASRLIELCRHLAIGPEFFFDGIELAGRGHITDPDQSGKLPESALRMVANNPDVLPLIEAFVSIKSNEMRRKVIELAAILGRDSTADEASEANAA